jgi:hypothetical protein
MSPIPEPELRSILTAIQQNQVAMGTNIDTIVKSIDDQQIRLRKVEIDGSKVAQRTATELDAVAKEVREVRDIATGFKSKIIGASAGGGTLVGALYWIVDHFKGL